MKFNNVYLYTTPNWTMGIELLMYFYSILDIDIVANRGKTKDISNINTFYNYIVN